MADALTLLRRMCDELAAHDLRESTIAEAAAHRARIPDPGSGWLQLLVMEAETPDGVSASAMTGACRYLEHLDRLHASEREAADRAEAWRGAVEQAVSAERATIIAFLRAEAASLAEDGNPDHAIPTIYADAIEKGEHHADRS